MLVLGFAKVASIVQVHVTMPVSAFHIQEAGDSETCMQPGQTACAVPARPAEDAAEARLSRVCSSNPTKYGFHQDTRSPKAAIQVKHGNAV